MVGWSGGGEVEEAWQEEALQEVRRRGGAMRREDEVEWEAKRREARRHG